MSSTAQELFDAGRLAEAIKAQTEEVRGRPADAERRFLLFSLLSFAGDFERAARQLEALGIGTGSAVESRTLLCRGLLAAESHRREIWSGVARPLLAPDAPVDLTLRLDALGVLARDRGAAARALDDANAQATASAGTLNGQAFEQIRDTDDVGASFVELFAQGRCLWLSFRQIRRLEIAKPEGMLDLLWLPALLSDARGNQAHVHLPTLYVGTPLEADDLLRLGRGTEWREEPGIGARGIGQKVWLTARADGEEEHGLVDVRQLEVSE